jgi:hypothetical protein
MNTPERNKKNAEKLRKLDKVLVESEQDKARLEKEDGALEKATQEYPLPTARKFAWVIFGGFWIFCLVGALFSLDFRAMTPFLFFSLAGVVLVHIPMFYVKRKFFDVVTALIFASGCIALAVSLMARR